MNPTKRIVAFCAGFLMTLTFNNYSMESNPGWLSYVSPTLLYGYSALKQFLTATTTPQTGFSDLPVEVQTNIIQLFAKSCTDTTLKEAGKTINALAQTNTLLNNVINDPYFNLQLIKNRARQFNSSDATAAKALQTKTSKERLVIQLALKKIIKEFLEEQENNDILRRMNQLRDQGVDFDFTYRWNKESKEYASPLMKAIEHDNKFLINYLLNNNANINQAGFNGKVALMYAHDPKIITLLAEKPNLNINQQDASGNTALLRAILNYFPEDEEHRNQNIAIIQTLLDKGANPTIANNNGETPLQAAQATADQEVIDIVQAAIDAL